MFDLKDVNKLVIITRNDSEINIPKECINNVDFQDIELNLFTDEKLNVEYQNVAKITTLGIKNFKELIKANMDKEDVVHKLATERDIAIIKMFSSDNKELSIFPYWESDEQDKNRCQTYNLSRNKLNIWIER